MIRKLFKNKIFIWSICVVVFLGVTLGTAGLLYRTYRTSLPAGQYEYQPYYNLRNYTYAIRKGVVERTASYQAEIIRGGTVESELPSGAELTAVVGLRTPAGATVYKLRGRDVAFDQEILITDAEERDGAVRLVYRVLNEDRVSFEADPMLYHTYRVGQLVRIRYKNKLVISKIAEKTLENGKARFQTEAADLLTCIDSTVTTEVIEEVAYDAMYISNALLTERAGEGRYLLSLCNIHKSPTPEFYSRIIETRYFNEDYSIIVGGDVQPYEMVYHVY